MAPASVYGRGYFAVPWSCSLGTAVQKRRGVYLQTRGGKPKPKAHLYVFENTPNPLQGPTPKSTRETHVSEDIGGLFRKASVPLERAEEKKRGGQTLLHFFSPEGKAFPPPHGAHHQPCLACKTRHPTLRQRLCLISTSFLLTRRLSLFSVPEREACAVGNQASVGVWAPFEPLAATNQLAAAAPQGGQGLACLEETWNATLRVIYEHFLPAQKWLGSY